MSAAPFARQQLSEEVVGDPWLSIMLNLCHILHSLSQSTLSTAAVPPTAGQLVTSERGVGGGPLAFHYANPSVTYCISSVIGLC
jgi:hypothetical protein